MLYEISKNLGKSSVAYIQLAEEQTTKIMKIYKILIIERFAKINPREKSTHSQFAKLNPCEMLKKNDPRK